MRRFPPWVWLVLAVVFATAATFVFMEWLKHQSQQSLGGKSTEAAVVVAAKDISAATPLEVGQLKVDRWKKAPAGSFAKPEAVQGRVAAFPFGAGEPILEAKLGPKGAPPGLPALLPAAKRAMTVKVDEASQVAGFLAPDHRVDVVATINRGDYSKDPLSRVVLQNLKVLGTGQKMEQRPGEKPQVVPTVTLEVSPEEGERLALAAQEGHITLVLRGQKDQGLVRTAGVTTTKLMKGQVSGASEAEEAVPKETVVPEPSRRSVEVLRRLKRETVTF